MDRSSLSHWLAEEVWELFQAGPVGLYKFIEILNSDYRPKSAAQLSLADKRAVARSALDDLLARSGYRLRWTVWATDHDRAATRDDIADKTRETPTEAPYLVIAEVLGAQ